jgi:hypothetical protein
MGEHDDATEAPAGWIEALERSEAELAAGMTVPMEPVIRHMRECISRMDARRVLTVESGIAPER